MNWQRRDRGSIVFPVVMLSIAIILAVGLVFYVGVDDGDSAKFFSEVTGPTSPLHTDTDGDGLPDGKELHELSTSATVGDSDQDGLLDGDELKQYHTNPSTPDTDKDGIADGTELQKNSPLNPRQKDTDQDGLSDHRELTNKRVSPSVADTDHDSLKDGAELQFGSNPKKNDTDGDTVPDAREYALGSSPTASDTDGDTLNDSLEARFEYLEITDADTDDDGLLDGREYHDLRTNASVTDMDRDGLPDGVEVKAKEYSLEAADPLQRDVFIEVDRMSGVDAHRTDLRELKTAYANAPVQNPDGTTGITVHYVFDETVSAQSTLTVGEYYQTYYNESFDRKGYGYRHILLVKQATTDSGQKIGGVTYLNRDGAIVTGFEGDDMTGATAMHELGHILGLGKSEFVGIDTRKRSVSEYPSVMNYNYLENGHDPYKYSTGTGSNDFDDWGHLESGFEVPQINEVWMTVRTQDSAAPYQNTSVAAGQ